MDLPIEMPKVDVAQVLAVAKEGSPLLLDVAGRAFGLGQAEREDLSAGKIPWWTWAVLGLAAGFTLGARMERKHRGKLPAIIAGK